MGQRVLHATTAVVLLLAPAFAMVVLFRADPEPASSAGATTAPTTVPTPAPTTVPTPAPITTPSPALSGRDFDPCLIGTWRETSGVLEEHAANGDVLRLTGSGATQTFRADGTMVEDFGSAHTRTGTFRDKPVELVVSGSITYQVSTGDGMLHFTELSATGSAILTLDSVEASRERLSGSTEPARYTCTATTLRETASKYTLEFKRAGT